jgi:hypothetical protein
MEKLQTLTNDLALCYDYKIQTVEGFNSLSNNEKSDLCKGVRNEFTRHLQSKEMDFTNLIRERISIIESIFINFRRCC